MAHISARSRSGWHLKGQFEAHPASSSVGLDPALVGIELGHGGGDFGGVLAEVFLVDNSILVHDKGHNARVAVFGRIGNEGEAARKLAVDEAVFRSAPGRGTLFGQDAVVVAMKWSRLAWLQVVA